MCLYGCYGNNQVVVKYTEGESKVIADNVNAENFYALKCIYSWKKWMDIKTVVLVSYTYDII